jgi:cytochrome c biogenesis protein
MLSIGRSCWQLVYKLKADPGIPLVYTGFGLLMLSVMMSYLSPHANLGFRKDGRSFMSGRRTNRARNAFEREVVEILDKFG